MKILFICTGNTCRSPMAEALTKEYIPEVDVQSAGLFAIENGHANPNAIAALQEKNIRINHKSQSVSQELIEWADVVLTMTTQHKQSLIYQYPNTKEKYFTLKEYVANVDNKVWKQTKRAYSTLEKKKEKFLEENERKIDPEELGEKLEEHLYEDMQAIRELEKKVDTYDIVDPFGGDINVYRKSRDEIEEHIKLLKAKVKRDGGNNA